MCQMKFNIILVTIGALLLLSSKEGLASSDCLWEGPFLENIKKTDLIVRGKILPYSEATLTPLPSLEVEILEIYKGIFDNTKIQLTNNQVGSTFLVGTEWVFALKKDSSGGYIIPNCWSSYLKIESSVVGSLTNTPERDAKQRVDLDEFNNLLQGKDLPSSLIDYEEGIQVGLQQCKASYEPKNGILYIPVVNVSNGYGDYVTYEVTLTQRMPSFIFDLDLNSVKAYRQ